MAPTNADNVDSYANSVSQELQDALRLFLIEFKSRIERFYKDNGKHAALPVYWNVQHQQFLWANRETRRKNKRNKRLKNGKPRNTGK